MSTGTSAAAGTLAGAPADTGTNTSASTGTATGAPTSTGADTAGHGHPGSATGTGTGIASTTGTDSSTSASPGGASAIPGGAHDPVGAGAGAVAGGRTGSAARPRTSAAASTGSTARADASVAVGSRATGAAPVAKKAASGNAGSPTHPATPDRGNLTVGAAKAGALLDRQLTLARTRAHSTALQALGSSRFHAVADKVAVLASEVPLTPTAATTDLRPLAAAAEERLTDAVSALPLVTAGHPYNAEALVHGLSPDPSPHPQDAPWHQVRLLLRLHRYALEVLYGGDAPLGVRLVSAGQALDRHRDASEAAAAAAQAARTPRIAPATAYALGVLHADQRHEVEAARYAFQRSWQKQTVGSGTS
ncbi:CHAD domain-containing protein [Streptomyces sp. NEAU-NA10]|uniref:CHAD domain-containing protein n=1 Tax=Streptomyces sp. NEAU-NA10 TaxID=3416050 RepID=UPI003CC67976